MDTQKEINCRKKIAKIINDYGWAHTLSALEFHLADSPIETQGNTITKYQILNQFGLSALIEQAAIAEGVSHEIGWLIEIRKDEMQEVLKKLAHKH